jgi:hypothetical protein
VHVPVDVSHACGAGQSALDTHGAAPPSTLVPITNTTGLLTPPPGVGFTTMTSTFPALATRYAGTAAFTTEPLTYVVANAVLPKNACAPGTNPLPERDRLNAPDPGLTDEGVNPVNIGVGLSVPTVMSTVVGLDPPPGAGLDTPRGRVPAVDKYDAGTSASSSVGEV